MNQFQNEIVWHYSNLSLLLRQTLDVKHRCDFQIYKIWQLDIQC